ncbi:MAG: hypothetical protein QF745_09310, partial [Planctomycetota bacterium]|nr:hypothetical protein [Planctomycetota bacterium]
MSFTSWLFRILASILSLFILFEVNYPHLTPQAQLSVFALLGLSLVILKYPIHKSVAKNSIFQGLDLFFATAIFFCFGYILIQTEPLFQSYWFNGQSLGNRAGLEHPLDHAIGLIGLILVLEATRRAIGFTLPLLALAFLA